jgi:hypothetical protein
MPLARPISMGYVADTLVAVLQVVVYKRLLLQQLLGQ